MAKELSNKLDRQIDKAGLPRGGAYPFIPKLERDKEGRLVIKKALVTAGPKRGKRGFVDDSGHIWIKDRAHADLPDHWDVQIDGGERYDRVDLNGNLL